MHGTFKTIETKADPFSLESLIAWLEKQPADETYDFIDCEGGCLIGLYGKAVGLGEASWHNFHSKLYNANLLSVASDSPYTFGAALDRARAALVQA